MPQMAEMMARSGPMCSERDEHRSAKHAGLSPPMMSKAQVVYYICRGGKMEPPHMIEVPYSHYDGLRLRDVKHRLTILRGGGMPNMFAWSFKRTYKNTHIWQDVSDDDSLTPVSGGEYILKGSEYIESNQDRSLKSSTQAQADIVKNPEVLQRKFRGAETWLKAPGSLSPKALRDQNSQTGICHSYEKVPESYNVQSMTNHLRNLGVDNVKRTVSETVTVSEETGMHDIKVCEVRSQVALPADHACNAGTQTEDTCYSYPVSQDYKSSGSSTPNCFGSDRSQQRVNMHSEGTIPVGKASKPQNGKSKRKLGRRFAQPQGKESGPNVKMKHSAASCVFLHILSYCGGVETKVQTSAPPTEIASSEYSFEGLCRAENKLVSSQNRSPQYSMELHKDQLPYQGMDGNRSGPLIPYSSEYFDVKEAVSPLQASPLQAKSSKAASSPFLEKVFQDMLEEQLGRADEDNPIGEQSGDESSGGAVTTTKTTITSRARSTRGQRNGADGEWIWPSCTEYEDRAPADQRPMHMHPWKQNLRLSKRRFLRHWWQALLQSVQARAFTGAWRKQKSTKRFFVGKRRRSRVRSFGYHC